jgi:hypothetical protein
MKNYYFTLLFLALHQVPLMAQGDPLDEPSFPFSDYWPVLLLPIFGIVLYKWWRSKKRH